MNSEKQTKCTESSEKLLPLPPVDGGGVTMTIEKKEPEDEVFLNNDDVDFRGDLISVAEQSSLQMATTPDGTIEQYRAIPPAVWAQVNLFISMGQAATDEQVQKHVSHLTGQLIPKDLINYHVFVNRKELVELRNLYQERAFERTKEELIAVSSSPAAMPYKRMSMMLGAIGEGLMKKIFNAEMGINPSKYNTLVSAFQKLQDSDPVNRLNLPRRKDDKAVDMINAVKVVDSITAGDKGNSEVEGVQEKYADETLNEFMKDSDVIVAGPKGAEEYLKEQEDAKTEETED